MSTVRVTVYHRKESGGHPVQLSLHGATPVCGLSSSVGGLDGGEAPTEPEQNKFLGRPDIFVLGSLGCMA